MLITLVMHLFTNFQFYTTALPSPTVIITATSSPTAGQRHSLTCIATTEEHLIVAPMLNWVATDGIPDVTENEQSNGLVASSRILSFNPLHTSHGRLYTCQARIDIPSADIINRSSSITEEVQVQSKSK